MVFELYFKYMGWYLHSVYINYNIKLYKKLNISNLNLRNKYFFDVWIRFPIAASYGLSGIWHSSLVSETLYMQWIIVCLIVMFVLHEGHMGGSVFPIHVWLLCDQFWVGLICLLLYGLNCCVYVVLQST